MRRNMLRGKKVEAKEEGEEGRNIVKASRGLLAGLAVSGRSREYPARSYGLSELAK